MTVASGELEATARTMPSGGRAGRCLHPAAQHPCGPADELNVLGSPLQPCGIDPVTGFYRDGHCTSGPEDLGSYTVCAVVSAEFLALSRSSATT